MAEKHGTGYKKSAAFHNEALVGISLTLKIFNIFPNAVLHTRGPKPAA